jgi:hypothetical protein
LNILESVLKIISEENKLIRKVSTVESFVATKGGKAGCFKEEKKQ